MQSRHLSIVRAINNSGPYNFLTFPTHERYSSNWSTMSHTFYLYQGQGIKPWVSEYASLPKNHILLDGTENQLKNDIQIDGGVISQNKAAHFEISRQLAQAFNVPLITIEHTLPPPNWNQKHLDMCKQMVGKVNVYISEYSAKQWQADLNDPRTRIIHHGINTELFKPMNIKKERRVISVCNDMRNRQWACGFNEWQQLVKGFPNKLIGDNPGISTRAKNVDELVLELNKSYIYVNSSLVSPVPTALLEGMACGLVPVSLSNCMVTEIIQDGVNGFISNDIEYLRQKTNLLLNNEDLRQQMSNRARQTILEKFSLDVHIAKFMSIFDELYGTTFE